MDPQRALEQFGRMPAREMRALFRDARPISAHELAPGLYFGRATALGRPARWFARHVLGRDYFAKLVADGWGVNVRVLQDGAWTPRPSRRIDGGALVDFPFRLTPEGLHYGWHLLGADLRHGTQLLDFLRARTLEDGSELVLGYMAPLGIRALAGAPFAMIRARDAAPEELEAARDHVARKRFVDSSTPILPAAH